MATFSVATLVCADLKRSRAFYQDVLGLRVKRETADQSVDFALGDGMTLSLHAKDALLSVRPGSLQLGFLVDDVDAFVAECVAKGVPVFQDPVDEPPYRLAVISDPDGYPLQIAGSR